QALNSVTFRFYVQQRTLTFEFNWQYTFLRIAWAVMTEVVMVQRLNKSDAGLSEILSIFFHDNERPFHVIFVGQSCFIRKTGWIVLSAAFCSFPDQLA